MVMMEFQRLVWKIQRELKGNRKPILLLFGNGYESQLLLAVLYKLRKKFTFIHCFEYRTNPKVRRVINRFVNRQPILLCPSIVTRGKKHFWTTKDREAFGTESMINGFSTRYNLVIAGFKLDEVSHVRAFHDGIFDRLYCPFLRWHDDWIKTLYDDMVKSEKIGKFLRENLTSDS